MSGAIRLWSEITNSKWGFEFFANETCNCRGENNDYIQHRLIFPGHIPQDMILRMLQDLKQLRLALYYQLLQSYQADLCYRMRGCIEFYEIKLIFGQLTTSKHFWFYFSHKIPCLSPKFSNSERKTLVI